MPYTAKVVLCGTLVATVSCPAEIPIRTAWKVMTVAVESIVTAEGEVEAAVVARLVNEEDDRHGESTVIQGCSCHCRVAFQFESVRNCFKPFLLRFFIQFIIRRNTVL